MLHRIIDRKWSTIEQFDVEVLYNTDQKMLKFKLSESFKKAGRPIIWNGETNMDFLITDYNDPNVVYEFVSFKISDIVNGEVNVVVDIKNTFSIYTRRLFKNYVFEAV